MNSEQRYAFGELKRDIELVGAMATRASAAAKSLELAEPVDARFDAPPDELDWRPMQVGGEWGGRQQWAAFRASFDVPDGWPAGAIELRWENEIRYTQYAGDDNFPAGPEGQLFVDGRSVGAIDQRHTALMHDFKPGGSHDVRGVFFAARCGCRHRLATCAIALIDPATHKLYHDLRVAMDIAEQISPESLSYHKLRAAIDAGTKPLDLRTIANALMPAERKRDVERSTFYASVADAQAAFDEAMDRIAGAGDVPQVVCVGHAHIDLAWLWPVAQTRHKCVRTFATQCRLLDRYDQWVFQQSSPQAYAWVEQDAPELFDRIAAHVRDGRWDAEGAAWVEMDTNVPGGESLVRQLLFGKRYFKKKLGVDSRLLWLPDVFGYCGALPQLLRKAGVDTFITSKLSWSQYNRFPHDTFRWRGIDGSEVCTHFISTPASPSNAGNDAIWSTTYNAELTLGELAAIWRAYRHKAVGVEPLLSFGYGDGGGGPTEMMLETAARMADWPLPEGLPRIRHEPVGKLADRVNGKADQLPVWDGELYLEYHRGTYTSQAWLKRANRKNEIALHNAEWLGVLAGRVDAMLKPDRLAEAWEELLLNQFHDILPGSSVGETYDEARLSERRVAQAAEAVIEKTAQALAGAIDTAERGRPVVLFNTLGWDRTDPIKLPSDEWIDGVTVPAGGWCVVDLDRPHVSDEAVVLSISEDGKKLTNAWWSLTLDDAGHIVELIDRDTGRNVITPGAAANQWQVFEDRPLRYDAWDIDPFYADHPLQGPTLEKIEVVETGEVRIAAELTWRMPKIGDADDQPRSVITQRIAMYARHPRIDFETQIEWVEHHQLLKVAFPVEVRATEATYEIQYGHLCRPAHTNTEWDAAQYEVCAHRWVDLSEHGFGVALLNDCKYGHDIRDGVIRLTCIKSAQAPDVMADQGRHEFTYCLLPHAGAFQDAGVPRAAAELNTPVLATEPEPSAGKLPAELRPIAVDHQAIVIDTLKPAEDGKGVIVRMYESHGSHARTTLTTQPAPRKATATDLLENLDESQQIELNDDGDVTLDFTPFEVKTLRFVW